MSEELFVVLSEIDNYTQVRMGISEFRDKEYVYIRKYYLDFDETWKPTSDGINLELTIETTRNMLEAIAIFLSNAESKTILEEYFSDSIQRLLNEPNNSRITETGG